MARRAEFDLYLITDRNQTGGRPMEWVLQEALEGGIRAVQLREKDLPIRELLRWAERLRRLTSDFGAKLIINDRTDVCLAVHADGVHLRTDSLPIPSVRRMLGPGPLIGKSTHSTREAAEAAREGADFVVLGPIYATPSKRAMGTPLGLSAIKAATEATSIPVLAVGGMNRPRIRAALERGAAGVALISAVLAAPDPRAAAAALLRELEIVRESPAVLRR